MGNRMSFTTEQMRSIQDRLAEAEGRNVLPPLEVVRATAVLIGADSLSEVICNSHSDGKSTSWRVVGLLDSGCLFTVMAVGDEGNWDSDRDRKSTRLNSSHRCISYPVFC